MQTHVRTTLLRNSIRIFPNMYITPRIIHIPIIDISNRQDRGGILAPLEEGIGRTRTRLISMHRYRAARFVEDASIFLMIRAISISVYSILSADVQSTIGCRGAVSRRIDASRVSAPSD